MVETFPPLEGIKVDHAWGGPTAGTLDFSPSVGVMGDHKNIYYGAGYNEGAPSAQTGLFVISAFSFGCLISQKKKEVNTGVMLI